MERDDHNLLEIVSSWVDEFLHSKRVNRMDLFIIFGSHLEFLESIEGLQGPPK